MPEVTSDELGRRLFRLRKEKVVDDTIEKIRVKLGPEWNAIPASDLHCLKYVLGVTWVSFDRGLWEKCAFTRLTREDLSEMIAIGRALHTRDVHEPHAIKRITPILERIM